MLPVISPSKIFDQSSHSLVWTVFMKYCGSCFMFALILLSLFFVSSVDDRSQLFQAKCFVFVLIQWIKREEPDSRLMILIKSERESMV